VRRAGFVATIAAVRKRKLDHVKALPWLGLLQGGVLVGKRWRALSAKERARLIGLLRESRGRAGNLSPKEREELHRLIGKLDVKGVGKELAGLVRGGRRTGRRSAGKRR
jgi:hypothetical protein